MSDVAESVRTWLKRRLDFSKKADITVDRVRVCVF